MIKINLLIIYLSTIPFIHQIIDQSPPSGSGCCLDICAVGDLNGDGKDDVAMGSENSIGTFWYESPFWIRHDINTGNFTTDGEVYDLDGDGDKDIIISCWNRGTEWYENTGSGWNRELIGYQGHDVEVADISGDGNLDVIVLRKSYDITWYESPTWTRRTISSISGEGLATGDIDGDGDIDVIASRSWFENPSWSQHTIDGSFGVSCKDVTYDMDGDGDIDVILSHSETTNGRVSWFENPTWSEHNIGILDYAHSLEVADFDKDGDIDVFSAEMHTSSQRRVCVFENTSSGWSMQILSTSGSHNARIGDINGDKKIDIVGKNYDGSKVVEAWINDSPSGVQYKMPDFTITRITPNPANDVIEVDVFAFKDISSHLDMYDVAGRLVSSKPIQIGYGRNIIHWNLDGNIPSGTYFIRTSKDWIIDRNKVTIVR